MPRARSLHCGPTAARLAEATAKRVGPSVDMTKELVRFYCKVSHYGLRNAVFSESLNAARVDSVALLLTLIK